MTKLIVANNGKIRKQEDLDLVDKVFKAKADKDPWKVVDLLTEAWTKRTPEEAEAVKIQVKDQKEVLFDPKYATTKDGKSFDRRLTIIFPQVLMNMIRKVYSTDELKFDSAFYAEFAKRYPSFKIPEKI